MLPKPPDIPEAGITENWGGVGRALIRTAHKNDWRCPWAPWSLSRGGGYLNDGARAQS